MSKIIIAIDGYAGSGKGTLAKGLARELGYTYIDSGAMYRAVTLYALRNGVFDTTPFDPKDIIALLYGIDLRFECDPVSNGSTMFLNGENVEEAIRRMDVSLYVSKVSAIPEVRTCMVAIQRMLGSQKGIVMDGRDIGSHVFPDAELKLFMTASIAVRTQRRYADLCNAGQSTTRTAIRNNLLQRDHDDTHRSDNPLMQAADAIVLDSTHRTREEQLAYALAIARDILQKKNEP